jgi:2-polyprenyl-6-methoxyphenol hydroxylase-like FAD-dependent oxidoreductase
MDFRYLSNYTHYPFGLVLPQNTTERVLTEKLESFGVKVFRPHTLMSIQMNSQNVNEVDISFDDGQIIQASYVVGADGARSAVCMDHFTVCIAPYSVEHTQYTHQVRQLAGIRFVDPDGDTEDHTNNLTQMVIADVTLSSHIPDDGPGMAVISPDSLFLFVPLTSSMIEYQGFNNVYRLICGVPVSSGPPPHTPPTPYLQDLINKYGPIELSSDPSANPNPIQISHTLWSSRFRTHSAAADRFFTRFGATGDKSDANDGGVIFLVGDAAHIHSPAGGQGMNLGLRDAIFLGPVLVQHINQSRESHPTSDPDAILWKFASIRHKRALAVIRMTKVMLSVMGTPATSKWFWWFPVSFGTIRNIILRILGQFAFVRRMAAWRVSGLGVR